MSKRHDWIWGGALLLLVVLAYIPAMSAGLIWDDDYYLTNNPHLLSIAGLWRAWSTIGATAQYYPMIHTTLFVEHALWGLDPLGYHVDNILLHGCNSVLAWRLFRRLEVPGAWLAASIFALHPVEVESVAWISERKNVLSTFFYLSAMLCYFRDDSPDDAQARPNDSRWYLLSLVFFFCALFSKTVTASLPAAILVIFWWKRGSLQWKSIRPLLLFVAVGVPMGLLTAWMEKNYVGAAGSAWDFSMLERLLIAGRATCFYLGKLVYPSDLSFTYTRWEIDATAAWQYAYLAFAVGLLLAAWVVRHRFGRGPLAALLLFGGTMLPALGFVALYPFRYSFVADHFQYLASLAPIALFAAGAATFSKTIPSSLARNSAAAVMLLLLGWLTFQQTHVYHDRETLWQDVIAKNPTGFIAYNNLATYYYEENRLKEAAYNFRRTVEIHPGHPNASYNLGQILALLGDDPGARSNALRQLDVNPDHVLAHELLARQFEKAGDVRRSVHHYRELLRIRPGHKAAKRKLRRLE
jgi:tetratricopeptide (TPR) repeat protein